MSSICQASIAAIPNVVIPMPAWATALPQSARGSPLRRAILLALPALCQISNAAPKTSHAPRITPIGPKAEPPVWIANANAPKATDTTKTGINDTVMRFSLARFHDISAPTGKITAKATMNGVKAASKNGGPTLSLRSKNISATRGQMVPIKTTKHATASKILLATNALSRLTTEKTPLASIRSARRA